MHLKSMFTSIAEIRDRFPALKQQIYGRPLVYLDNGATTQKPQAVLDVLNEMEGKTNGNIHRAVHYLSLRCTECYEQARRTVCDYIGADKTEEVIFTSGTTAAINMLAFSFGEAYVKPGDTVLITQAEHHSDIVPWQMLCARKNAILKYVPVDENGHFDLQQLPALLQGAKIFCFTQMSNVLGLVNPVKELTAMAHRAGAAVLVDGAQGIVHGPVDVKDWDVDFYVFSGHKFYGPTGTGVLYGKEAYLEKMPPWQGGGDMIASVSLTRGTTYARLPMKFEAGTANYIGATALGAALRFMQSIDPQLLVQHEEVLARTGMRLLSRIPGLRIYGTQTPVDNPAGGTSAASSAYRKAPLFSFSIVGAHPNDLALLLDRAGIALRSGQLCAEPLLERYGLTAVLRASFGIYNTLEELEYLVDRLQWAVHLLQ